MATRLNPLAEFWPTKANADECLFNQAETPSDALFLAVHQPTSLVVVDYGKTGDSGELMPEKALLEALLAEDRATGTVIIPIVGSSGVGKSHMIRWLDASLKHLDGYQSRHVVRIPKSSSLRRVLELIVEGLPEQKYGDIRRELISAKMPPDLLSATNTLLGHLLTSLQRKHLEAKGRLENHQERGDDYARFTHCSSQGLQTILMDPETFHHFLSVEEKSKGVLARIAERCLQGAKQQEGEAENQFTEADLDFTSKINRAHVAKKTVDYLNTIDQRNGEQKRYAVQFLNEVVDDALAQMLDFGGYTLTDLFVRIRKIMLSEKRELILLVEDFAALAGIQNSLLDAILREGVRGDEKLCMMRTALAVTEGYLTNRETVGTRAKQEWRIKSLPFDSNSQALACYVNFTGAYLNAARWGKSELEKMFLTAGTDIGSQSWVKDYYQEQKPTLKEDVVAKCDRFESTDARFMLFPFNEAAIHQLLLRHLKRGDQIEFDPRKFINRVLRSTLIFMRVLFETSQFPPGAFHDFKISDFSSRKVGTEILSKAPLEFRDRLAALVYFWGDDPDSAGVAASLGPEVYASFELPSINWSEKASKPEGVHDQSAKPGKEKVVAAGDLGPWQEKLNKWRQSNQLSQPDANKLRDCLARAIEQWLDWDRLLLKPVKIENVRIYLPRVQTGNREKSIACLMPDEQWDDDELKDSMFEALEAVIRYQEIHGGWDYPGADTDYVVYANLIEGLSEQAAEYFQREGSKTRAEDVSPLAQALLIGARVLNIPGSTSNDNAENIKAMFAPLETDLQPRIEATEDEGWKTLRQTAMAARKELQDLLLTEIGARQGGADKIWAVDASRLLAAIKMLRETWQLPEGWRWEEKDTTPVTRDFLNNQLRGRLVTTVKRRQAQLKEWRQTIDSLVGDEFEVSELVKSLTEVALQAHKAGTFQCEGMTYESLREQIKKLETSSLRENLELAKDASEQDTKFGSALSALAKINDQTVQSSQAILRQYDKFLSSSQARLEERIHTAPGDLQDEVKAFKDELNSVEAIWRRIGDTT